MHRQELNLYNSRRRWLHEDLSLEHWDVEDNEGVKPIDTGVCTEIYGAESSIRRAKTEPEAQTFLPAPYDPPSWPQTHRRRDSWRSSPALWLHVPPPAAGNPSYQVGPAAVGSVGKAALDPVVLSGFHWCWWTQSGSLSQQCAVLWSDILSETPKNKAPFNCTQVLHLHLHWLPVPVYSL